MSKLRQFEDRIKDWAIKDLMKLAHDTLQKIKEINERKSEGVSNPLGLLSYTMLLSNMIQNMALEEAADMATQITAQLMEKMKARKEAGYVG